jgi:enamine deaminase RidA (YjgF/YER057c/UK114 family)
MEKPVFIVAPGAGETFRENLHFSSAVKIGNRVETSGQGGWNDALEIPDALTR